MNHPPTGIVTFLFTDIQGSTPLWEQYPHAMRLAVACHDSLLRDSIRAHKGFLVKTTGDGALAAFATAPDAIAAALSAQRAIMQEEWGLETPLRVRMGLHTGLAELRESDYYGSVLNIAARLMAAGHGEQVLVSQTTQDLCRDALPPDAALRDLGERRFKDLTRPERVFQLLHPDLPAEFPPLRSLNNPSLPNNLPLQVTSFVGREKQVSEVQLLLEQERLLTLTGAGGSGKTRLSLQVAAALLDQYFDGVWLVELAPITDPALVPQVVAEVLGVKEVGGEALSRTLAGWLKDKRLLLMLDNCEHLLDGCALLAASLLRGCPDVRVLASSREPLNVPGEQCYRVPSLTQPDPETPLTVETLSQYESARLFVERARSIRPAFAVTTADVPALAQICWTLDGIPLALELAAAHVRGLSVEEIKTRLDQRFRLLTGGSRTTLPRQQTLRALIDWSYDLLTEPEKALLCRLSVFSGGWTMTAAEGVCSGENIEEWEVLDLLTSLVSKSLIVFGDGVSNSDRYRLLETIRQYAGDRLAENGGAEAVQARAASWYLALAEEAEPQILGPEQALWLSRLEAEHDNLRATLAWYEHQTTGEEDGLCLAGALWRFWFVRGHLSEGRQWLGRALSRAETGTKEAETAKTETWRARALNGAGVLANMQADFAEARALHEKSLSIARRQGNRLGVAKSLGNLASVVEKQGNYEEARILFEESLTLLKQLGDQTSIASVLSNLGNATAAQADFVQAQALHEESLSIRRQLGDRLGIAKSLGNLGAVAESQSKFAEARILHEECLSIMQQLGDRIGIASVLNNLGNLAAARADFVQAQALHEESLTLYHSFGDQISIILTLEGMMGAALKQGQMERAAKLGAAAAAQRESIGSPLKPIDQEGVVKMTASAAEALGAVAFAAAWGIGRAMTMDEAVAYALSGSE